MKTIERLRHFSDLSPAAQERLALLIEECAEVIQVGGKILRHGYESCHPDDEVPNEELLAEEIGHVRYAVGLLLKNQDIRESDVVAGEKNKAKKVTQYLHHQ